MAFKMLERLLTPQKGFVAFAGSFLTNGASSPVTQTGIRYTVAHTGTGLYTVTFLDKWVEITAPWAHLYLGTPVAGSYTVGGALVYGASVTNTMVVGTVAAGALADIAAAAGNLVSFGAFLRNTSVNH